MFMNNDNEIINILTKLQKLSFCIDIKSTKKRISIGVPGHEYTQIFMYLEVIESFCILNELSYEIYMIK